MKKPILIISISLILGFVGYWGITLYQMAKGVRADTAKYGNHYDKFRLKHVENNSEHILTENKWGEIELNKLNEKNLVAVLQAEFSKLKINKQIGQQDGPDFNLYALNIDNKEFAYFSMDSEDSTQLNNVTILNSNINDVYGLKVGSSANELIAARNNIKFNADLHMNIYARAKNSYIQYRLKGELSNLNDSTYVSDDYSVEGWQTNDMHIESIIWEKKNGW